MVIRLPLDLLVFILRLHQLMLEALIVLDGSIILLHLESVLLDALAVQLIKVKRWVGFGLLLNDVEILREDQVLGDWY